MIEPEWAEEVVRAKVPPVVDRVRQDADDFVRFAIHANGAADDVRGAAEAVLPEALTDDHDAVVARHVFTRQEIATELRLDA